MKVILSSGAGKQLKKLPKIDQIAVAKKIRNIQNSNNIPKEEKVKGFALIFRVRVGDYRIVYKKTRQEIFIVLIRHRKEVYQILRRLLN